MNHCDTNNNPVFGICQQNDNELNIFLDRINFILQGRKITPWAKSIGLSNGDVSRIKDGKIPGPEKLVPICRTENISLNWLLEGVGEPYMVHHTFTDEETAELVSSHANDERWQILVLKNNVYPAIVLTLPAIMQVGKNEVKYTAVEIIAGPMDAETLKAIMSAGSETHEISLDEFTMRRLYAGKVSNQEIFGNAEISFYSQQLTPFNNELPVANKVAEKPTTYIIDELMRKAIYYIEDACLEDGIILSPKQKSRAYTALYKHMLRTHTTELDSNTVMAILDSI